MLHSAILLIFIRLPSAIKIIVLSFFVWPFYTSFTVCFIINSYKTSFLLWDIGKNSALPNQIPPTALSDQGIHCLLTECSIKNLNKKIKKKTPNNP